MKVTGRLSPGKVGAKDSAGFLQSRTGAEIAREARIAELRRLVASGRYKVEPTRLAMRIMARALRGPDPK
jgi:anti-sigma28 factor (negative regulator of flagellin synthesis)